MLFRWILESYKSMCVGERGKRRVRQNAGNMVFIICISWLVRTCVFSFVFLIQTSRVDAYMRARVCACVRVRLCVHAYLCVRVFLCACVRVCISKTLLTSQTCTIPCNFNAKFASFSNNTIYWSIYPFWFWHNYLSVILSISSNRHITLYILVCRLWYSASLFFLFIYYMMLWNKGSYIGCTYVLFRYMFIDSSSPYILTPHVRVC